MSSLRSKNLYNIYFNCNLSNEAAIKDKIERAIEARGPNYVDNAFLFHDEYSKESKLTPEVYIFAE